MTCEVCFVFDDVSDTSYLHAFQTHIKILHKALQWSDCEDCRLISADIDEDILTEKIPSSTINKIKEHIKALHQVKKKLTSKEIS